MKTETLFLGIALAISSTVFGQVNNCFLEDYEPKTAEIPESVDAEIPAEQASVLVTLTGDSIGLISKYVYGNAIAAWAGAHDDPVFVEGVENLSPTLIRFPGGSWSDGYFWNGLPGDLPDSVYDGTTYNASTGTAQKIKFWPQAGGGWVTSPDQYYALRTNSNVSEGLITINYGYARYGTSTDPVAKAAKLAADWVRYDAGHTKFWEIGNESGGPWEYGWMIDTALNQDGQPQIITGELYGKHFKIFADSMRNAAAEEGATIYIGGQVVVDGEASWNFVDRTWNAGFFNEAGDSPDFYVIHDYYNNSNSVSAILNDAQTGIRHDIEAVRQDITDKEAYEKPIALTEYNMSPGNDAAAVSNVGAIQAVLFICEMMNNNYGLGARWLLNSGEVTMFYAGSDENYLYHPHAEFYYLTYLQKLFGDKAISSTSSDTQIASYASTYSSGETAMVIVNKGPEDRVITVSTETVSVGNKYYIFSFTGDADGGDFSQDVYINGAGPEDYQWGPYDQLFNIKADAYTIDDEIKFTSPARSVQMIILEEGTNYILADESDLVRIATIEGRSFALDQNKPNPVKSTTSIGYQLLKSGYVSLKVLDFQGREISSLVSKHQNAGKHQVQFDASGLHNGVYFYRIECGEYYDIKKFVVIK